MYKAGQIAQCTESDRGFTEFLTRRTLLRPEPRA